jgi:hypothetical protein
MGNAVVAAEAPPVGKGSDLSPADWGDWWCEAQQCRGASHATRRAASGKASPFEAWRNPEK